MIFVRNAPNLPVSPSLFRLRGIRPKRPTSHQMAKNCQIELFLTIEMTLFLELEFSEFLIGGLLAGFGFGTRLNSRILISSVSGFNDSGPGFIILADFR